MFYAINPEQQRITAASGQKATCPSCGGAVRAKCGKIVTHHWAHVEKECDPFTEPMTEWHRAWQETVPEEYREVVIGPHRADIYSPLRLVIELQHSSISVDEIREREEFYGQMIWLFDATAATNSEAVTEAKKINAKRARRRAQLELRHDSCDLCLEKARAQMGNPRRWPNPAADTPVGQLVLHNILDGYTSGHIAQMLQSEGLGHRDPRVRLEVSDRRRADGSVMFWWKHPRKSIAACQRPVFLDLGCNQILRIAHIDMRAPCDGYGHLMHKFEFVNLINGRPGGSA